MSGNMIMLVISIAGVIASSIWVIVDAWRSGREAAKKVLQRAQTAAKYGFPPDPETGWGISTYDPRSDTWGDPFAYDPDREVIDNALARWRANGDTGRYRVIRKTTVYEIVTQEPEKNSGESSQEGTGIMAKHKGSSGDTPGAPTTGESVDNGNIIFVNKPDSK